MNDSVLKQFSPRSVVAAVRPETEPDEVDDFVAFGFLRGVRDRALMLALRSKSGSVTAFGYGWLEKIEYDPSGSITLQFGKDIVKLIGRNLNAEVRPNVRLVDALMRHKVPYVQESGGAAAMTAAKDAAVIDRIEFL
jgi:hypothetical protein